jgi:CubicO group peptidase (beta-lactamase class C family)
MNMTRKQWIAGLVLAVSGLCAAEDKKPYPDTPAGKRAAEVIEAINTGDEKQIRALLEKALADKTEMDEHLPFLVGLAKQSGGIDVREARPLQGADIGISGVDRKAHRPVQMMIAMEAPDRIRDFRARAEQTPLNQLLPDLPAGATDEQRLKAIADALAKAAEQGLFSGTFAIAKKGDVVLERAFGYADRNFKVPNQMNTRFHIGSMPKMFTSVAIAQLAQQGKLKYEDPIAKYLSDYPNQDAAKKITLHHLLTHTSGLGDYFGLEFDKKKRTIRKLEDYYQFFANKPLLFEPGARFSYSNAGMHLAGIIVERVSGMDYYEYLRKNVFGPAGMKDTDSDFVEDITPNLARGYTRIGSADSLNIEPPSKENTLTLPPRGGPAGGGYSTAGDLIRFANALYSGKLISAEYLKLITAGKVKAMGPGQYGYGFIETPVGAQFEIGHSGGAPGMNAVLSILPESGWVVTILSNWDPPFPQQFAARAVQTLVKP